MHPPEAHGPAYCSDTAKHQCYCFEISHVNYVIIFAGAGLIRYNFCFTVAHMKQSRSPVESPRITIRSLYLSRSCHANPFRTWVVLFYQLFQPRIDNVNCSRPVLQFVWLSDADT